MYSIIEAAFSRKRTAILILTLVLIAGVVTYVNIPKESEPDIQIPVIYVSTGLEGISPADADRLLVRPLETELEGLEGVDELSSRAEQGHASVTMEFDAAVDIDEALADVRDKVDRAKADLPSEADEPTVNEVNLSLQPVIVAILRGEIPERTLLTIAKNLRDRIETLPNVLEAEIVGDREEALEIIIDPQKVENYNLQLESLLRVVDRNNVLVAAGALDNGAGRFPIKAPGVFERFDDLLNLPLVSEGDRIVRLRDIASVRRTFKDPEGFARLDGEQSLAIEVKKRLGSNIIETTEMVRAVVALEQQFWPETVSVAFSQDKSGEIRNMLKDLQNNVLSAVILVMIVIIAALGFRSALLVGFAVPGSFLLGIMALGTLGLTVNIVVLFSLIMAVGMLVDGAIVVTEYADRKLREGYPKSEAYKMAAKRMAWPITASTATTLAAFSPLLFWPGIVGEFMRYLPITLSVTLFASLLMALVFVPILGSIFGGVSGSGAIQEDFSSPGSKEPGGFYVSFLKLALRAPLVALGMVIMIGAAGVFAYGAFGKGVEFFPEVEPELAEVHIHGRGSMSVFERDLLVREVEDRIIGVEGVEQVYGRSSIRFEGDGIDEDTIGFLLLEFYDWNERRPVAEIFEEIRGNVADLPGIHVELRKPAAGPPVGKPVQIQVASRYPDKLEPVVDAVRQKFDSMQGLIEVTDSRPVPGIEWQLQIDREQASRFGTDIATAGSSIQLVTNGLKLGTYRPDDSDDEIDIVARYPMQYRHLEQLDRVVVNTEKGGIPLSNFVTRVAAPKESALVRNDGKRVYTVGADVEEGLLADDFVQELRAWIPDQGFDPQVELIFKGEDEEQKAAQAFLLKAFGVALFLIAIILVTQFNSFYQSFLILSAIVFSVIGVLLGLLVRQEAFGIVMSGVGVIALAGIVVNNNIVLIDTYNEMRNKGFAVRDAIIRTGAQRLRPVMLTTVTTVLGLMPMVLRFNVDLFKPEVTFGGPSTAWWVQLATAIAGGLAFATILTLVLTPCLLLLGHQMGNLRKRITAFIGKIFGDMIKQRSRKRALPAE